MTSITYSEVMREIDKFRGRKGTHILSKEQIKFIKRCRSGMPVPYKTMGQLWEKLGWGVMTQWSMQRLHEKLLRDGVIIKESG